MRLTKEQLKAKLTTLFHIYGFDGTTLARLGEYVGLQKASLYHHFPDGKESMARAVLEQYQAWDLVATITPAKAGGSPRERLAVILENIIEVNNNPAQVSTLDVFTIGEAREKFYSEIQSIYQTRRQVLRQLAQEAGVPTGEIETRLDDFFVQFEGAHVMFRVLGNFDLFVRTLNRLPEVLLGEDCPE